MRDAVVVAAIRTPIGRDGGALRDLPVEDLAGHVMAEVVRRTGIDPRQVDDVIFGCAIQVAPVNNIARVAWVKAGLPVEVPGTTINRLCGSGLQAINFAAQTIQTGNADLIVCGGFESMTRSPYILEKATAPYQRGSRTLLDAFGGAKSSPPSLYGDLTMGITAENVAEQFHVSRQDQDAFAYASHMKAVRAIREGRFKDEIVPVELPQKKGAPVLFDTDEHPRPDTTLEKLAALKPVFRPGGTVTAGNSSGINDGAAALVLTTPERARKLGLTPMARVLGFAVTGVDPRIMGIGPAFAIPKLLSHLRLTLDEIDVVEINEAFASQTLACLRELKLPEEKLNPNGGAIALGHPLGASGARITTTLLHHMRRHALRLGIASLCVGGGQGIATLFENLG